MHNDLTDTTSNHLGGGNGPTITRRRSTKHAALRWSTALLVVVAGLLIAAVPSRLTLAFTGSLGLYVFPANASLPSNANHEFTAWACPRDADGNFDLGPDGIPGTSDDICEMVNVEWSVQGSIGTVSSASGTSTIFEPADLWPGETAHGFVVAADPLSGRTAAATVEVFGPSIALPFCISEPGETDKRTFEFISSFGTRFEIDLTCVNGAAAVAELKDHPTLGDMLQFEVEMLLRNREKRSRELFSRYPIDGSVHPLLLEQSHELKFSSGRDAEVIKVVTEIRELDLR